MVAKRPGTEGAKSTDFFPLGLGILAFVIHAIVNPHYGFFRDELYFIICGRHPAFGYVDQPPVVPLLGAFTQLFGNSLFALRLVPSLAAGLGVYASCLLAIEIGGGAFAQVLTALLVFFTPVLTNFGMKLSTDTPDLVFWPLLALLVVRLIKGGDPRLWLGIGVILGLSFESKYTVVFLGVSLVIAFLLSPQRKVLWSRWALAGLALATAIALPNIIWQVVHGLPMLELLRNGQNGKNIILAPTSFLFLQLIATDILMVPITLIGAYALIAREQTRILGWTFFILLAFMILTHAKFYYPINAYAMVFAAGAVAIESFTVSLRLARPVIIIWALLGGMIFAPFDLPVLSEAQVGPYTSGVLHALHIDPDLLTTEHNRVAPLPPDFADMTGWPELASSVAAVYNSLPATERTHAVIKASNYGEAAAIEFFDKGLPVISGHNNYWLWGTHGFTGNVLIDVHGDCGAKYNLFDHTRMAAVVENPLGVLYEQRIPVPVCTGIHTSLNAIWPSVKEYI